MDGTELKISSHGVNIESERETDLAGESTVREAHQRKLVLGESPFTGVTPVVRAQHQDDAVARFGDALAMDMMPEAELDSEDATFGDPETNLAEASLSEPFLDEASLDETPYEEALFDASVDDTSSEVGPAPELADESVADAEIDLAELGDTPEADATEMDGELPTVDDEYLEQDESTAPAGEDIESLALPSEASNIDVLEPGLTGADLTEADLTEADLTEADLTEASIAEPDLVEADFAEPGFVETDFAESDFVESETPELPVDSVPFEMDPAVDVASVPFEADPDELASEEEASASSPELALSDLGQEDYEGTSQVSGDGYFGASEQVDELEYNPMTAQEIASLAGPNLPAGDPAETAEFGETPIFAEIIKANPDAGVDGTGPIDVIHAPIITGQEILEGGVTLSGPIEVIDAPLLSGDDTTPTLDAGVLWTATQTGTIAIGTSVSFGVKDTLGEGLTYEESYEELSHQDFLREHLREEIPAMPAVADSAAVVPVAESPVTESPGTASPVPVESTTTPALPEIDPRVDTRPNQALYPAVAPYRPANEINQASAKHSGGPKQESSTALAIAAPSGAGKSAPPPVSTPPQRKRRWVPVLSSMVSLALTGGLAFMVITAYNTPREELPLIGAKTKPSATAMASPKPTAKPTPTPTPTPTQDVALPPVNEVPPVTEEPSAVVEPEQPGSTPSKTPTKKPSASTGTGGSSNTGGGVAPANPGGGTVVVPVPPSVVDPPPPSKVAGRLVMAGTRSGDTVSVTVMFDAGGDPISGATVTISDGGSSKSCTTSGGRCSVSFGGHPDAATVSGSVAGTDKYTGGRNSITL